MNDNEFYDVASIYSRWEDQEVQFMTPEEEKKFDEIIKEQERYRENLLKEINK